MLKGVTRRIVEIKSPASDYFERAVLYLRSDKPYPRKSEAIALAEEYLESIEPESAPKSQKNLRLTVIVLTASLIVSLLALAAVLILFTKM